MKDKDKTKNQLITELIEIRQRVAEFEKKETETHQSKTEVFLERHALQRTIDAIPDLIATVDTSFKVMSANKAMADRLGLAPEECIGQSCFRIFHGTDQPPSFCPHSRLLEDGQEHKAEVMVESLGGYFVVTASPLTDDGGKVTGCVHVARDITERKHVEDQIRENERRYKGLADSLPQAVTEFDENGNVTFVNQNAFEMFGYTSNDADQAFNIFQMIAPQDLARAKENIKKVLNGEKLGGEQYLGLRKDGSTFPLVVYTSTVFHKNKPVGLRAIVIDTTERTRMEEAMRQKEMLLSATLESTADGILVVDEKGKVILTNDRFAQLWHIPPHVISTGNDNALLQYVLDQLEEPESFLSKVNMLYQTTDEDFDTLKFKDGRFLERFSCPLLHYDSILGRVWSFRDITGYKLVLEALQRSEANFSTFFNTIQDFLFVSNMNAEIIMVNDSVVERLGYSRAEIIGKTLLFLHPSERWAEARETIQAMLQGKSKNCPIPLITKSGKQIPVETRVVPGRWNNQDVLFGVSKDISELRLSEEKFSKTFQSSRALMALTQYENNRFMDVNEAFLETMGYAREEVIGRTSAELNIFVDISERDAIKKVVMEKGKARNAEVRVRTKDGNIRYGLFSADCLYVQDTLYLLTTMNDISERKRLENSLNEQLLFLQTLIDTIPNPIFFKDDKANYLGCNKAFEEYHGITRESIIGKSVYYLRPEEEAYMHHLADMDLLRKPSRITYENLHDHADGSQRNVINNKATFMKPDGAIGGIVGVMIDITDRKLVEEDLKRHKDYLEKTVQERTAELQSSKEELEIKTKTLEEVNVALKVLLRQIEEDKRELEERFAQNIKQLILPYIEKIKTNHLNPHQSSYMSIIETNLNEIVSPFLHSLRHFNMTPRETQIATLIKDGRTTKEIAAVVGVAPSAIDTYRNRIRQKLDLNNKKINLQSYLQSLK